MHCKKSICEMHNFLCLLIGVFLVLPGGYLWCHSSSLLKKSSLSNKALFLESIPNLAVLYHLSIWKKQTHRHDWNSCVFHCALDWTLLREDCDHLQVPLQRGITLNRMQQAKRILDVSLLVEALCSHFQLSVPAIRSSSFCFQLCSWLLWRSTKQLSGACQLT